MPETPKDQLAGTEERLDRIIELLTRIADHLGADDSGDSVTELLVGIHHRVDEIGSSLNDLQDLDSRGD